MGELAGKRAIVSGASRGIGRGIALELARAGASVAVNYRSNSDEADEVVSECKSLGVEAFKIQADLAEQDQAEAMVDESVRQLGGIDIVVSNAAYSDRHLMLESEMAEFRKTIDVSMWGRLLCRSHGCTSPRRRRQRW